MLKMMGKGDKLTLVAFGLSHRNLDLLREGRPIKFNGSTCGLSEEIEFVIFAGPDEQTMQREIQEFVGPGTKVRIDPRFKE